MEPLAFRLRPSTFDEIVGQKHLVGPNGVIRKLSRSEKLPSIILYGKPGIGKTTIATVICKESNINYEFFNASTDNKAKLQEIIKIAKMYDKYILIIDEIHRMKKDIQDYLLPYAENGTVTMIGITTVNPYMAVNPAIRSRCLIYALKDVSDDDLKEILFRAIKTLNNETKIEDDAIKYLVSMANGEVRILINSIESVYNCLTDKSKITLEDCVSVMQKASIGIDKNEDAYFQALSGLHKSIRGSDVDAALHYMAVLLSSEDLISITRRLKCIAYEDIGLANPSMGPKVKAACDCAIDLGLPEARLPLASIVIDMALSPKSNTAMLALDAAISDVEQGKVGSLPPHLKNTYSFDGKVDSYKYPHDYPGSWVYQQYLPDILVGTHYYKPKASSKYEEALMGTYENINKKKEAYEKNSKTKK